MNNIVGTDHDCVYIKNSDVSYREEEAEGALLFNPDTDDVLIINITGLLVWEALAQPRTQQQVVESLESRCDNVPADQVANHVSDFMSQLIEKGFVNVYKETT